MHRYLNQYKIIKKFKYIRWMSNYSDRLTGIDIVFGKNLSTVLISFSEFALKTF